MYRLRPATVMAYSYYILRFRAQDKTNIGLVQTSGKKYRKKNIFYY